MVATRTCSSKIAAEITPSGEVVLLHVGVTANANGPNHFNSSIEVDVAAGGTARVTSPTANTNRRDTERPVTVSFQAP